MLFAQGIPQGPGIGAVRRRRSSEIAQAAAPADFTGYWVSVVTEDWRWRMVTPIKGDFASIPLSNEGRRIGDAWDPDKDTAAGEQCKAYGAPAIMRVPGRLHISLGGRQHAQGRNRCRRTDPHVPFHRLKPPQGREVKASQENERTWQGYSAANWERPVRGSGSPWLRPGSHAGRHSRRALEVVTTGLRAGYLRKNGPPYSENTVVKEYYDLHKERNGDIWFTVTTVVDDPKYLNEPFVTSTDFKKIPDGAGWSPSPCVAK